jgi:hypothetical protein
MIEIMESFVYRNLFVTQAVAGLKNAIPARQKKRERPKGP